MDPFTKALVTVRTRLDSTRIPSAVPGADPSPDVSSLPCFQCKGLLPDKLAIIFSQLAHIDFDVALDLILCGDLAGPPDTEIAISRMPTAFVAALASAGHDDLARAAEAVETHEVEELGASAQGIDSDLTAILVEL